MLNKTDDLLCSERSVCLFTHLVETEFVTRFTPPTIVFPKFVELGYGEFCTPLLFKQGTFVTIKYCCIRVTKPPHRRSRDVT